MVEAKAKPPVISTSQCSFDLAVTDGVGIGTSIGIAVGVLIVFSIVFLCLFGHPFSGESRVNRGSS